MRVYYDRDCDINLIKDKKVAILGYGSPGPCPCAEPARFRRQERRHCAARRIGHRQEMRSRGPEGHGHRRSREVVRPHHVHHARRIAGRDLQEIRPRQPARRRRHRLRPWPQRPFRPDRAEARRRCHHDGAEGPRPHGARRICQGRRRALPCRRPSGRVGQGDGNRPVLLLGHRRRPFGHHRDQLPPGMRNRPLRRTGGALRRPRRTDPHGLRDAGRGRLRARDGLFRVPARGEADRGPDLRRRHRQHELLDLEHRRIRRVCLAARASCPTTRRRPG